MRFSDAGSLVFTGWVGHLAANNVTDWPDGDKLTEASFDIRESFTHVKTEQEKTYRFLPSLKHSFATLAKIALVELFPQNRKEVLLPVTHRSQEYKTRRHPVLTGRHTSKPKPLLTKMFLRPLKSPGCPSHPLLFSSGRWLILSANRYSLWVVRFKLRQRCSRTRLRERRFARVH